MVGAARIRRGPLMLAVLVALTVLAAGCGSGSSGSSPTAGTDVAVGCDHWCGNGSAIVTFQGITTTISGGGCYDGGSAGVDVRFGDWQGVMGVSSYLMLTAYREGGPTPTPAPTPANPLAAPTPTDHPSVSVSGSLSGSPFILGPDAIITLSADGKGSFSGSDVNGEGFAKGTFTCG